MNPEAISLVRESWKMVVPIQDKAAELFYGRLFELDPTLKPLFKGDMREQGRKLMAMISVVVNNLDNLGPMIARIEDLGRRHVAYGVTPAHYDTVGGALLWTLGKGLGEQFSPGVKEAWTSAYGALSGVMKAAAYPAS